jgi:hypothetical protein
VCRLCEEQRDFRNYIEETTLGSIQKSRAVGNKAAAEKRRKG